MNQLGAEVRRAREHLGVGVREFARRVRTDPSYISHIESGERIPSLRALIRLADALYVAPEGLAVRAIADIRSTPCTT